MNSAARMPDTAKHRLKAHVPMQLFMNEDDFNELYDAYADDQLGRNIAPLQPLVFAAVYHIYFL